MLKQLEIQNVALIDKIILETGKGLNVLTGETGAGKSVVIDSINALLGERTSKDIIRTGKDKAIIEAVFVTNTLLTSVILDNYGIQPEADGTLIISREFTASGRSTCRINGRNITLSILKEVTSMLVDIHGQHDNQSLLITGKHIKLLDLFGGDIIIKLKSSYKNALQQYKSLTDKLHMLVTGRQERERQLDYLKFQVEEIKKAKLSILEDDDLKQKKVLITNSNKIKTTLTRTYDLLSGNESINHSFKNFLSLDDILNNAATELNEISKFDMKYISLQEKLRETAFLIADIISELRNQASEIETDPLLLEKVEERLDLLSRLKKKYGKDVQGILDYCFQAENKISELTLMTENETDLRALISKISSELMILAIALHEQRLEAAGLLEKLICSELAALEMKGSEFKVKIDYHSLPSLPMHEFPDFGEEGLNDVEFLISPNPGEPLKPLSKIASGGELSRIMLAIKSILAKVDDIPALIFDEIDIGISGLAARRVSEKLASLSRNHQVICVTHLAQIAAMADNHFFIEKHSTSSQTLTSVSELSGDKLTFEIARLTGGLVNSEAGKLHAEEMLKECKFFKEHLYLDNIQE